MTYRINRCKGCSKIEPRCECPSPEEIKWQNIRDAAPDLYDALHTISKDAERGLIDIGTNNLKRALAALDKAEGK